MTRGQSCFKQGQDHPKDYLASPANLPAFSWGVRKPELITATQLKSDASEHLALRSSCSVTCRAEGTGVMTPDLLNR
jgi:hypothetical protein